MSEEEAIKRRFERVNGELNEQARRLVAASRGDGDRMGRDLRYSNPIEIVGVQPL